MSYVRRGLTSGLIVFAILFYLNVIGLPNTLGSATLIGFSVAMATLTVLFLRPRPRQPVPTLPQQLSNGLIIGLIGGVGLALVTGWFASLQVARFPIIDYFAQILPDHTGAWVGLSRGDILAGVPITSQLITIALTLTGAGLLGGLLTLIYDPRLRQANTTFNRSQAFRYTLLVLPLVFYGAFLLVDSNLVNVFDRSENIFGLVLVFLFISAGLIAWRNTRMGLERIIVGATLLALMLLLPRFTDLFQTVVLAKIAIFFMIGLGLNIVLGFAGLLDLGYVAFFAVGAYTFGLLSAPASWVLQNFTQIPAINFWIAIPLAALVGIAFGLLLGTPLLRLRGDYLAIVTLGFGQIIYLLLTNLRDYTGGPGGVLNIPAPAIGELSLGNPTGIFYLGVALAGTLAFIAVRLRDSRFGRAWIAIREDQDAAQAMGINLVTIKLMAFATGAAFAAVAGVLYGANQVNIFPDNFRLETTIDIVALVIIGGLGSIEGVLLGAVVLIGMPELLRGVDEYRVIAFGALLVAMMILRPEGLLPSARVQAELHEADRTGDVWLKVADAAETQGADPADPEAETA